MLSEDSILFPEIVDQILLVPVQPASNGDDENVQRVGHPVRLCLRATMVQNLQPSFGTLRAPT